MLAAETLDGADAYAAAGVTAHVPESELTNANEVSTNDAADRQRKHQVAGLKSPTARCTVQGRVDND